MISMAVLKTDEKGQVHRQWNHPKNWSVGFFDPKSSDVLCNPILMPMLGLFFLKLVTGHGQI